MNIANNWEQLEFLKDTSETHVLKVDKVLGNCWIKPRNSKVRGKYMSTHTFYSEGNRKVGTRKLQKCGFDIELGEWEKQSEYYSYDIRSVLK